MAIVPKISRRKFIRNSTIGAAGMALGGFSSSSAKHRQSSAAGPFLRNSKIAKKVIVLGMDGVDPDLLAQFIAQGELPTFKRFVESNHFGKLQTTMPPHSPVAWSSFITGTNPGGHGIYDFVHRDPKRFIPYMSTSRSFDGKDSWKIGKWNIPLESGHVDLMRKGPALWSVLEQNGIPASVFAIPANFPVVEGASTTVSGMGTPDLLGTYGTFTYFTDAAVPEARNYAGGRLVPLKIRDHRADTTLSGPKNTFRTDINNAEIPITIHRDPWEDMLRVQLPDTSLVLKKGEWSQWVPISFEMVPLFVSVAGMVRFYVKEVHPHVRIYCSPINVDPMEPILPICTPEGYSRELAEAVGRFYTQGFPADGKALSHGVLSNDEYFDQAKWVIDENFRIFDYQLDRFKEGLFFFYFSSIDQNCHMMWRLMDPSHPLYEPNASPESKGAILYFYKKMDEILRKTLLRVDSSTTLIAMSDHGFSPFTREFHLSTWLVDNGFTTLTDPNKKGEGEFYRYVDWDRTEAYALGINGLYINVKGREPHGIVPPERIDEVRKCIVAALTPVRDPLNGNRVITQVYYPHDIYSGPYVSLAPDLIVGYQRGYRVSDEAVLGKFPRDIIGNRTDLWAADHCLDPRVVPGTLVTNRTCTSASPGLWDLAPSILKLFDVTPPPEMTGQAVLA